MQNRSHPSYKTISTPTATTSLITATATPSHEYAYTNPNLLSTPLLHQPQSYMGQRISHKRNPLTGLTLRRKVFDHQLQEGKHVLTQPVSGVCHLLISFTIIITDAGKFVSRNITE
jgi:hypothetical protein